MTINLFIYLYKRKQNRVYIQSIVLNSRDNFFFYTHRGLIIIIFVLISNLSKKGSPVKSTELDLDAYTSRRFSDDFVFYWRILKEAGEVEGVLVVNGTSWVGIGWRPRDLTPACKAFPEIRDRPSGEPLPRPEAGAARSGTKRSLQFKGDNVGQENRSSNVQMSVTYRVSTKQGTYIVYIKPSSDDSLSSSNSNV